MTSHDDARARLRYRETDELRAMLSSPTTTDQDRAVIVELLRKRDQGAARLAAAKQDGERQSPIMGVLGVLLVLIGGYYLLVAPSDPLGADLFEGLGVVNLQRLYVGQTFALAGIILIAAEWRPR